MSWICSSVCSLTLLAGVLPLSAQTRSNPPEAPTPSATLKLDARTVVEDVVVLDKNGAPVTGLQKEDFQIFENGKPQSITFFDVASTTQNVEAPAGTLPDYTYTNIPSVAPNQTIDIVLMDGLNTDQADQMYVRQQMIKYLVLLPPHVRVGIFTLTHRLQIVQGFTEDSTILRAAIEKYVSKPSRSLLMRSTAETSAQSTPVNMIREMATSTGSVQLAAAATALQDFLSDQSAFEDNSQLLITLDAMKALARYLGGIPGRKNLIWFAGAVPVCLPDRCPYGDLYHETQSMLAAARVSVYPIDAGGVYAPYGDTSTVTKTVSLPVDPSLSDAQSSFGPTVKSTDAATASTSGNGPPVPIRPFRFINAETWATETGGKAFHGNDIDHELASAIEHGSIYYTLAYVPANRTEAGRERRIEVRVGSGKYELFYRKSYFERTKEELRGKKPYDTEDPLRPLMDRGMPNATELPFRIKLIPSKSQPAPTAPPAGDNSRIYGPRVRYSVGFQLQANGLLLTEDVNGERRRPIEVVMLVYGHEGKLLNWEVRNVTVLIKPEEWAMAQNVGIPFHFEIDAPVGDVYLRTGVYDKVLRKAGTLEIPLTHNTSQRP